MRDLRLDRLGIEVYADRPRDAWQRRGRELVLTTEPLDRASLAAAAGDAAWSGMPSGTVMGHVHLQVGDLGHAAEFFSGSLGFDRMAWSYPGALFLGAGGYHHHLGTNVWAGRGAPPPTADEAQLLEWTVVLPDRASLDEAASSLRTNGSAVETIADADKPTIRVRDPWHTTLRLEVEEIGISA
ncbi:MAG: VOC family protein [Acidobacteriota bacterium]